MLRLLLLAGGVKAIGAGVLWQAAGARTVADYPSSFPPWFHLLFLAVFCGAGALLLWSGRADARARVFAAVLVTFGTMFADPLLRHVQLAADGAARAAAQGLLGAQVIAFTPLLLWRFAQVFPRSAPTRIGTAAVRVSGAAGAIVFLANISGIEGLRWLQARGAGGLWLVLALLALPALPYLVLQSRRAAINDRRRVRRFLVGVLAGLLPLILDFLLASFVPPYAAATQGQTRTRVVGAIVSAGLLAIPILTAYAVIGRVFDVRFVIRRVLQYALARYTVTAAVALPALWLAWSAYQHRDQRLGDVLTLRSPLVWLLLLTVATLLWGRRMLLETIDRRFFREHYDARHILLTLASGTGHARTLQELATLVTAEIDRALHVARVALVLRDSDSGVLRDPQQQAPPLAADSPLAALVAGSPLPLDVALEVGSPSALHRLPVPDRLWLQEVAARILVPLRSGGATLLGILALGEKRSELPFNADDRQLLAAVAASVAMALEHRLLPGSESAAAAAGEGPAAQECVRCGRIHPRSAPQCRRCGGDLREGLLPTHLGGRIEVERRIGGGGMGVVYRGRDLTLDRAVALKTLPRLSATEALSLRREARAMAAVGHPHLASIHGAESWRGAPVLVLEYLPGGTLADRIAESALTVASVVATGRAIAAALAHLHALGILHRDVKPSNIGYGAGDVPKLMDFGLAKLTTGSSSAAPPGPRDDQSELSTHPPAEDEPVATRSTGRRFVGTTAYMSPEVLSGGAPSPGADLWSLAVTLVEALTRRHPFLREDLTGTFNAILGGLTVEPSRLRPECPPALDGLLMAALSPNADARPADAAAMVRALEAVGAELGP